MRPFAFRRPADAGEAMAAALGEHAAGGTPMTAAPGQFLAGGTTLVDLMKLDVMRPEVLVDINRLGPADLSRIDADAGSLRFGALVRMADAERHPAVLREYPVIAQSLKLAASAQIRNMASLGGNLLQRTRCTYFRDTSWSACNKRSPGSGCAAMDGVNRPHAVLGISDHCIATYPGDFAQALIALDATVEIMGALGKRSIPIAALHRPPGTTPHIETTLAPGELITAIAVPAAPWFRRSLYLKIRDRESYEFALASAAVALDLEDGVVREARIALGGVATVPWRAHAAETALRGQRLDEAVARAAAEAAFADAKPHGDNAVKVPLGKQTVVRALLQAAALEVRP